MPKKTAEKIVESGNEYVIQVKGNQKNLLHKIKQIINSESPVDVDYTKENNRSRIENREVYTYNVSDAEISIKDWMGLKNIIYIKTYGERNENNE